MKKKSAYEAPATEQMDQESTPLMAGTPSDEPEEGDTTDIPYLGEGH